MDSSHIVLSCGRLRSNNYYTSIENDAIEFSNFGVSQTFAKGDVVRSTFCKCLGASKILCMDSSHIVLSCGRLRSNNYYTSIENDAIEFSNFGVSQTFAKGDVVRSTFCKCLGASKILCMDSSHIVLSCGRLRSNNYYTSIENDAIEFSNFGVSQTFAKGDVVRSTFCKCLGASKILCMDSSHIVLSCGRLRSNNYYTSIENDAIEFSRKSRFALFAKGDIVRSTFCKCLRDSKFHARIACMSYYPTIFSDPKVIAYASRTKQLNVREKPCFRAVDESHLLRKSRKMRSHEKIK
jgi:regulator of extracellular matrix RemA (YlzA/DUF370 family)